MSKTIILYSETRLFISSIVFRSVIFFSFSIQTLVFMQQFFISGSVKGQLEFPWKISHSSWCVLVPLLIIWHVFFFRAVAHNQCNLTEMHKYRCLLISRGTSSWWYRQLRLNVDKYKPGPRDKISLYCGGEIWKIKCRKNCTEFVQNLWIITKSEFVNNSGRVKWSQEVPSNLSECMIIIVIVYPKIIGTASPSNML